MPPRNKLTIHTGGGREVFKQAPQKSRRERTLELGPARLAAAQKAIRHLRQLSNPITYELRGDEPKRIVATLKEELDALAYELENPGKPAGPPGVFDAT